MGQSLRFCAQHSTVFGIAPRRGRQPRKAHSAQNPSSELQPPPDPSSTPDKVEGTTPAPAEPRPASEKPCAGVTDAGLTSASWLGWEIWPAKRCDRG